MDARNLSIIATLASALLAAAAASGAEGNGKDVMSPNSGEEYQHLIGDVPTVRTDWTDITLDHWPHPWQFELTVSAAGKVEKALPVSGPENHQDDAQRIAVGLTFKPFEHDGHAVPARFRMTIPGEPTDYRGPATRSASIRSEASDFTIALRRTACFGTCPDYRVELKSDGHVSYRGIGFVLITGSHEWRVNRTAVERLEDLVQRAKFFELDGYYRLNATDLPTFVTRVHAGPRDKFVLDYGAGASLGGAFASTSFGGVPPNMPPIVSELEDEVDRASDDASWIQGDARTIGKLEALGWNFRSREAGRALNFLVSNCSTDLALQFLTRGAPVNVKGEGFTGGSTPATAARCADAKLVERLIASGALANISARRQFLFSSAESGNPEMVAIALKHFHNVKIKDGDGKPLLSVAAAAIPRSDDDTTDKHYDPTKVIELLTAAGADPNAVDSEGNSALVDATDTETVRALVKAGANPNARNHEGQTPLFDHYFADAKIALLSAGADAKVRDNHGQTPLFNQDSADAVRAIVAAGADINTVSAYGSTALEAAGSENVALALLSLGAAVPHNSDRLAEWIKHSRERKWTRLLATIGAPAGETPAK